MPSRSSPAAVATERIIDLLFQNPPLNPVDLEQRLAPAHRGRARRLLVDRLQRGEVPMEAGIMVLDAFRIVGVSQQTRKLRSIALREESRPFHRALALNALLLYDDAALQDLPHLLSPEGMGDLVHTTLASVLQLTLIDAKGYATLATLLRDASDGARAEVWTALDEVRVAEGIPATVVYRNLIQDPLLSDLRPFMLARLVDEGGADARELLESLRDLASDPEEHREYQGALLRLCTEEIRLDREPPRAEGYGLLGPADRQGSFLALSCIQMGRGGWVVAGLTVWAAGDVRDGLLAPCADDVEVERLVQRLLPEGPQLLARVPLSVAAAVAREGADRTRKAGLALPDAAHTPFAVMERFHDPAALPPHAIGTAEVGPEDLDALFAKSPYRDSWYFDEGDLRGAGVPIPRDDDPEGNVGEWIDQAVARLDLPPLRGRLAAMCRHMATWHAWRGEPDLASLLSGLADRCVRRGGPEPLVRRMLLQSRDQVRPRDFFIGTLGDPLLRQRIREVFLSEVRLPRGRDLAVLDFTETALACFQSVAERLPGERRPRRECLEEVAFAAADHYVRHLLSRAGEGPRGVSLPPRRAGRPPLRTSGPTSQAQVVRAITQDIMGCSGLGREESRTMAEEVLVGLITFATQVCEGCALKCLRNPSRTVLVPFFLAEHPGLGRSSSPAVPQ